MSWEKQPDEPEQKELVDAEYVDLSEHMDVPEPMPQAPLPARWRKVSAYLIMVVIFGGIAYWVVLTREQDRQEKAETSAEVTRFKDLETRYGPDALVKNVRSVVDADEAIANDGKLDGWSVVDEKGRTVCTNPQVEATVRLLHCETVGQEDASQ